MKGNTTMKKKLILLAGLICLTCSIAACGNNNTNNENYIGEPNFTPTPTPEVSVIPSIFPDDEIHDITPETTVTATPTPDVTATPIPTQVPIVAVKLQEGWANSFFNSDSINREYPALDNTVVCNNEFVRATIKGFNNDKLLGSIMLIELENKTNKNIEILFSNELINGYCSNFSFEENFEYVAANSKKEVKVKLGTRKLNFFKVKKIESIAFNLEVTEYENPDEWMCLESFNYGEPTATDDYISNSLLIYDNNDIKLYLEAAYLREDYQTIDFIITTINKSNKQFITAVDKLNINNESKQAMHFLEHPANSVGSDILTVSYKLNGKDFESGNISFSIVNWETNDVMDISYLVMINK